MQRQVENTRNVIYCHCMAWMVSYPGITCMVHVCLKWPVDSYVQGLEVITAEWRKKTEQSLHSVCSSLMPLWTSAIHGYLAK
jgi:hypothetical protein